MYTPLCQKLHTNQCINKINKIYWLFEINSRKLLKKYISILGLSFKIKLKNTNTTKNLSILYFYSSLSTIQLA